jgi:cation:H+ antiporter
MIIAALSIIVGLLFLTFGADRLVLGSSAIALKLGVSPLLIGITIVAFGTSAPELIVSINAALSGNGGISVGNVVGSNIANIGLILGVASLITPMTVHVSLIRRDIPIMIGISLISGWFIFGEEVSRGEGIFLVAGLILFLILSVYWAKKESPSAQLAEFEEPLKDAHIATWLAWVYVAIGLGLLAGGSELLVGGAVYIAEVFGMSQTLIGLTIVAIGTSLPELATSITAAMKGESDIAVGNVVGSNIFNALGILGIAAIIRPLPTATFSLVDLGVMLGFTILMLPMARNDMRILRWEAALLLSAYVAYMGWLISGAIA